MITNIHFGNMQDLLQIGISVLTGERDNTMTHRMLCDLSKEGVDLFNRYFDLPPDADDEPVFGFKEPWNSTVGDKPSVAAVMIAPPILRELAIFALITQPGKHFIYANADCVWTDEGENWQRMDEFWQQAHDRYEGDESPNHHELIRDAVPQYIRDILRWKSIGSGDVNQRHAMSGRA